MKRQWMKGQMHAMLVSKLIALSLAMFAFGYVVMPPLYNILCDITGLNGRTNSTAAARPDGTVAVSYTHLTLPTIYSV